MKIGLDLGNGFIKAVAGEHRLIIKSLATTNGADNNYIVRMGEQIHFGIGEPLIANDKTKRKYLNETFLLVTYLLAKEQSKDLHKTIECEYGIGLPLLLFKSTIKAEYQEQLNEIRELKGYVNGEYIKVNVKSIKVFAEGYSSFLTIKDQLEARPTILFDFGYRTTDIITISKNAMNKWQVESYHTVNRGMHDLLTELQKELIGYGEFLDTTDLEQYLRYGYKVAGKDLTEIVTKCKDTYNKVIGECSLKFSDMNNRQWVFTGGGAEVFESLCDNEVLVYNDSFLNALGYQEQMR